MRQDNKSFIVSSYTEDHLGEQPAIQLMQHELGWEVVNCYGDPTSLNILRRGFERQELRRTGWSGGFSNQGRDGKPSSLPPSPRFWRSRRLRRPRREGGLSVRLKPALRRLNPDLPAGAIEGAVEENGILNFECWILNGRGRLPAEPRLNLSFPALSLAEENREIEQSGFPLAVGSLVFKQFP
jgi:hypothetical protein